MRLSSREKATFFAANVTYRMSFAALRESRFSRPKI